MSLSHLGLSSARSIAIPVGLCMKESIRKVTTADLNVQFLGTAQQGQWLEFKTQIVKIGSTLDFADEQVLANGISCVLRNATFKVIRIRE